MWCSVIKDFLNIILRNEGIKLAVTIDLNNQVGTDVTRRTVVKEFVWASKLNQRLFVFEVRTSKKRTVRLFELSTLDSIVFSKINTFSKHFTQFYSKKNKQTSLYSKEKITKLIFEKRRK